MMERRSTPLMPAARELAALDEFLENIGPCHCMQCQTALAHVTVVVAVLCADQIGIGPHEDAELAVSRIALAVPNVDGIGVLSRAAASSQGHKEGSSDAVGAEAGNDLEQVLAVLASTGIAIEGV